MDDTDGLGEKRLTFQQHPEDEPKELLIKFGDVYLLELNPRDGLNPIRTLISPNTVEEPTVMDCFFFKFPRWILSKLSRKNHDQVKDNTVGKKANGSKLEKNGQKVKSQ